MNKDALLATLIGFIIGLCITGIILAGPKLIGFIPKFSIKMPSFTLKSTPTPKPENKDTEFRITIDSPIAESIESQKEILVSGTTSPDTTVVVQNDISDAIVKTTEDGKYAGTLKLEEGKNDITVTGYHDGLTMTQSVTVYYTPETL